MKIRFYAGGLLLLAALGLTGCSTVEAPSQHVVLVDHEGRSLYLAGPKARKIESTNDFHQHLMAITQAIATDTNCIAPDGTRQILIFVHGGLNTYNQSLARVNEMTPEILAAHYYPLFVNWDSGLKSSYLEHLFLVRQGEVEPVWGPVTFPLYFVADVGRAVTRAPVVWYYQLTSDFTTTVRYESPIRFSHEGRGELDGYYRKVANNFAALLTALANGDAAVLRRIHDADEALGHEAEVLRDHHLERLRRGLPSSVESSLLHLEVLTFLRMIHDHLANLAAAALPAGTDGV
jgi:hypothetical protein